MISMHQIIHHTISNGAKLNGTTQVSFHFTTIVESTMWTVVYQTNCSAKENLALADNFSSALLRIDAAEETDFSDVSKYVDHDNMMRYVEKLVQNSERHEYHKIPGNHLLHMTNPEGTASLLKKFILDITEPVSLDSLFDNFNKFQSV